VGTGAIREDADTQYLITHERRCSKRAFVDARGVKWGLCRLCYVSSPARARAAPPPPPPSPSAASSHHSLPPYRLSPALPLTRAWWVVCVRGVDAAPSEFHRWRVETLSSLNVEPGAGGVSAAAAALRVVRGTYPSLEAPRVAEMGQLATQYLAATRPAEVFVKLSNGKKSTYALVFTPTKDNVAPRQARKRAALATTGLSRLYPADPRLVAATLAEPS